MAARSQSIAQAITATVAGLALLYFLRTILIPLVLAVVLAVLVNGLVRFIGKRTRRAPHWAIVTLTALIIIVSVVAAALIVAKGTMEVVKQVPALVALIDQRVQQIGHGLRLQEALTLRSLIGNVDVPHIVGKVAGSAGNILSEVILLITFFAFIVAGRPRMSRKLQMLARRSNASASVEDDLRSIETAVETYLWIQTVTGLMIAAAAAVVMFAVGLDHVLFWTVVLFLLCYVPVIGSTLGSILPALFALLQFPNWWQAAVIFGGIQTAITIVGNVIYPRMQAETQNIDPVTTLVAIGFWSILWGLAGAFLAVPLTLIAMMVCMRVPRARWVAVLLSNDGNPTFPTDGARSGLASH